MKKGLFYAILASVLWAIVNPFIKQGLSYDFTPMNFAGLRFTTVGIILFAYTSVSYTHLDVYKRQEYRSGTSNYQTLIHQRH